MLCRIVSRLSLFTCHSVCCEVPVHPGANSACWWRVLHFCSTMHDLLRALMRGMLELMGLGGLQAATACPPTVKRLGGRGGGHCRAGMRLVRFVELPCCVKACPCIVLTVVIMWAIIMSLVLFVFRTGFSLSIFEVCPAAGFVLGDELERCH
jgi:hypothetical protein